MTFVLPHIINTLVMLDSFLIGSLVQQLLSSTMANKSLRPTMNMPQLLLLLLNYVNISSTILRNTSNLFRMTGLMTPLVTLIGKHSIPP